MLQKRIGQLAEGNAAWLRLVDKDGKLRHVINPQGTVTGRMSSFSPNLQQVPAVRAEFGAECRELFTVPRGYQLVGADLSGIELRVLAHFLNDGGAYGREILEGDIHTANMKAAGLSSRDQAKTMIYALCYNAGDQRLGQIIGKGAKEGRALRDKFFSANPAFPKLLPRRETRCPTSRSPDRPGWTQAARQGSRCTQRAAAISCCHDRQEMARAG